jgi:hypothetical protein
MKRIGRALTASQPPIQARIRRLTSSGRSRCRKCLVPLDDVHPRGRGKVLWCLADQPNRDAAVLGAVQVKRRLGARPAKAACSA